MSGAPLVEVRDLSLHFPVRRGVLRQQAGVVRAVDGVSFEITEGETLGLVGESGCGKSSLGRTILRLVRPTSGSVRVAGQDLAGLSPAGLRATRRHMQMIFQSPFASLNPRLSVGSIIREPLDIHRIGTARDREARVGELLSLVGLDPDRQPEQSIAHRPANKARVARPQRSEQRGEVGTLGPVG